MGNLRQKYTDEEWDQIQNQAKLRFDNSVYQKDFNKSGFFDLPIQETCNHPDHEPPKHIHIPQGKGYKHICPRCGKQAILIPPQITY